jgi:hypothetical protein
MLRELAPELNADAEELVDEVAVRLLLDDAFHGRRPQH